MRLTLYIDGKAADLSAGGDDALVLWTYTRDDADAPAAVKNSYTKTVTLPATDANAAIFGHAGTLDRVTATGMFDALQRTPFIIYGDDGRILERGYLKLDRIARRGETVLSYDVTLYGGLGGFFYGLTYNADGTKKTLGDLYYLTDDTDEQSSARASSIYIPQTAATVAAAWSALTNGTPTTSIYGLLNFAPCYNGVPSRGFDAKKAYYKPGSNNAGQILGLYTSYTDEDSGNTYTPRSDADGGILIDLGTGVTEWEIGDFRAWQQRPVLNLRRFLRALTLQDNSTGWTFVLDANFFTATNAWYNRGWITLPLADAAGERSYLADYLSGTGTPADYLLGIAKTLGLAFVVDPAALTVTLMARDDYYETGENAIDLSDRVAKEGSVRPNVMTARIYDFMHPEGAGAWMEKYAEKYGRGYGSFRLDSGYMFDADIVDVMQGNIFRGAADARESSPWYYGHNHALLNPKWGNLKWADYELAKYMLYNGQKSITIKPDPGGLCTVAYVPGTMPQFHDADGKPTDGADVLLLFGGMRFLPNSAQSRCVDPMSSTPDVSFPWHLSDDNTAMKALNNDVPCWNISPAMGVTVVSSVPVFRRWLMSGTAAVAAWDFGTPEEVAFPNGTLAAAKTLFSTRWQAYMADRFDRDTMVMTARVDLSGLKVDASLLRRFFWYRGSLWSLNKITDYNPARPGLTECEFVRVQDEQAYTDGQTILTI